MSIHLWININMRCIEIRLCNLNAQCRYKININMRCIEIAMQTTGKMAQQTININMRCIEMLLSRYCCILDLD